MDFSSSMSSEPKKASLFWETSAMTQLQTVLSYPVVPRCHAISYFLKDTYFRELQTIFPVLVENIFGFSLSLGGCDWSLGSIQRSKDPNEFEAIRNFLSPTGPLLNLVYKLTIDGISSYDFEAQRLPIHSRQMITEGSIPGFYTQKLKTNSAVGTPHKVSLNAFEFYLFHFVYFLVNPANQHINMWWSCPEDFLYPCLLDDYLRFFLPFDGSEVPSLQSLSGLMSLPYSTSHSPLSAKQSSSSSSLLSGSSTPHKLSYRRQHQPLLKSFMSSSTPETFNENTRLNSSSGRQDHWHQHGESWCSETFLLVIVEFWLNVVPLSNNRATVASLPPDIKCTITADHVQMIRIFIKHTHYFSSAMRLTTQTSFSSFPHSSLDHLKRNVYSNLIQKKLYYFLRYTFDHWPLDASFRVLLELWLSVIQPWRYCHKITGASEDKTDRFVDSKWQKFIAENLLFYTGLFHLLMCRFFRMDLCSPENSYMLYRVTHVFSQPNLCSMIKRAEIYLLQDSPVAVRTVNRDPNLSSNHIFCSSAAKQSAAELEGPSYKYLKMFDDDNTYAVVKSLINTMLQALDSSRESIKLISNCDDSFWKKLYVFFGGNGQSIEDEYVVSNSRKVEANLTTAVGQLRLIFNIQEPDVSADINGESGTNLTQDSTTASHSFLNSSSPNSANVDSNGSIGSFGSSLTPQEKLLIINGLKRPTTIDYSGNPDLQPIRSYESAFLVRLLYSLSCLANVKFADKFKEIYYSRQDIAGRFLKQFLAPPASFVTTDKSYTVSRTVESVPPRLCLRFLANCQNIGYLFGLYFMLYLFGYGLFTFLMLLTFYAFSYGFLKMMFDKTNVQSSRSGHEMQKST